MELFDIRGCLTDEGLRALIEGQLDELQRLEAAEHLAYCDRCVERYTALLSKDVLQTPESSVLSPVMKSLWVRIMRNTLGRAAVAGVAAVLALTLWGSGGLQQIMEGTQRLPTQPVAPRQNAMTQVWDAYDEWLDELFAAKFEFKLPSASVGSPVE